MKVVCWPTWKESIAGDVLSLHVGEVDIRMEQREVWGRRAVAQDCQWAD
jgi:hypothetical protein